MTPQPRRPRVLIVDDHPANRMAYESILERDYSVYLADSGAQALELAEREEFAVILLDVRMPMMDGFETAVALRRREKTRYTPIIFTSAIDKTLNHVSQGFTVGATDYLFSPVDPEFLRFKVSTYAQMFLRNESLRLQIVQLNELLDSLRAELERSAPVESGLKARIRQLERVIDELKRQAITEPF